MIEDVQNTLNEKMEKTVHVLSDDFKTVRSGKASPSMVENISVDYYGNKTPLSQMATISIQEGKSVVIQPWDASALESIEKALLTSDLGVTPANDGRLIRLNFPPLSEEQRQNYAKIVHKKGEDSKISIRNIRRDGIHDLEKTGKENSIGDDEIELGKKDIQKATDDFTKKIDEMVKHKSAEIMEV